MNCDQALELIRSADDEALRNLLDMASAALVRDRFATSDGLRPQGDFDMAYCMSVLRGAFADRDYLLGLLSGGEPEAWFDRGVVAPPDRGATPAPPQLIPADSPADAATP